MPPPSKKRKTNLSVPEQISFDFAAREEYLTGFHKRKLARIKHAQEQSAKKEREDRIRARAEVSRHPSAQQLTHRERQLIGKQMRKQRREDLEKHVSEVNRLVKQANGDLSEDAASEESGSEAGAEWNGFQDAPALEPEVIDQEEEYVDEDKYTTVTIETVGISKHGFEKKGGEADEGEGENAGGDRESGEEGDGSKKRVWTKEKPKSDRPKKKKQKFRYESKADRKAERVKQGIKKKKMAQARKGK